MVSIIHAPPQEIVVTGLTSFSSQQNLASMIAFVMNVSGQPMALYWAEGVVFLADFVEPEALPDEYVKGKIYASNVSRPYGQVQQSHPCRKHGGPRYRRLVKHSAARPSSVDTRESPVGFRQILTNH